MPITLRMSGEGMEYEQEISRETATRIMEFSMLDGKLPATEPVSPEEAVSTMEEAMDDEEEDEWETLPGNFFDRLSSKQEAYLRVLQDADGWISNEDVRERMEEDHGRSTKGPQAIAGIRAGFTRKYNKNFSVDERRWRGNQNQYRLNPKYEDELKEGLAKLAEE